MLLLAVFMGSKDLKAKSVKPIVTCFQFMSSVREEFKMVMVKLLNEFCPENKLQCGVQTSKLVQMHYCFLCILNNLHTIIYNGCSCWFGLLMTVAYSSACIGQLTLQQDV